MKIALYCDSLLLQKTLEHYLGGALASKEAADFYICDKILVADKPIFLIGHSKRADLMIPFSKAELFEKLHTFEASLPKETSVVASQAQLHSLADKLARKNHNKIAKLAKKIL